MVTRAASFSEGEVGHSFEEEWPELARQLERLLAAKGVEPWLRADVIQETALRLYPRWETLDHSLPLWNLVTTIAVRVLHNHHRKESRIELVPDPVPMHRDDVHVRGLQRAQLNKTRSALQQLTADQRRVLLAEVGEALMPAGTRNRINVLRLRARASLREALGPWAPSAITIRLRHLRARIAQKNPTLEIHAPALANSLANVVIATTLGLAGAPGPAVDEDNPVSAERIPLLAMAELGDLDLDPVASIRRPVPPALSNTKDRVKKPDPQDPTFVGGTKEELDNQVQAVDNQRKAAEDWAEDTKDEVEDQSNEIEEQKDEVEDQSEWAECYVTNQC